MVALEAPWYLEAAPVNPIDPVFGTLGMEGIGWSEQESLVVTVTKET